MLGVCYKYGAGFGEAQSHIYFSRCGEMVNTTDLKSVAYKRLEGSIPFSGTK